MTMRALAIRAKQQLKLAKAHSKDRKRLTSWGRWNLFVSARQERRAALEDAIRERAMARGVGKRRRCSRSGRAWRRTGGRSVASRRLRSRERGSQSKRRARRPHAATPRLNTIAGVLSVWSSSIGAPCRGA